MPYITSIERIGYDRGKEQGQEEGAQRQARSLILLQLEQKFGTLPTETTEQISVLDLDQMGRLAIALLNFSSADDLTNWLRQL